MEYQKLYLENFYPERIFCVSILTCSTAGWLNAFIFSKRAKRMVSKTKKVKKEPEYRTLEERKEEVKNILKQLSRFELTPAYEPVKNLYKLFKEYIDEDKRIVVNIPFPMINRRIKGILARNKREDVSIALLNEKF